MARIVGPFLQLNYNGSHLFIRIENITTFTSYGSDNKFQCQASGMYYNTDSSFNEIRDLILNYYTYGPYHEKKP